MSILKQKDCWLSISLFLVFLVYQIFNIANYYLFQFADVSPGRIVRLILASIDIGFIANVFLQIFFVLFLHITVAVVVYLSWQTIKVKETRENRIYFTAFILGLILLTTLWNWVLSPASLAMPPSYSILAHAYSMPIFYTATVAYGLFFTWSFYSLLVKENIKNVRKAGKKSYIFIFSLAVVLVATNVDFNKLAATSSAGHSQPNIILIGVDSLRPDHLAYFGFKKGLTPHIDGFLKQAAVFEDTMTPFARTYPAWMSVLSGQYPISHGSRYNLYPSQEVHKENLLPAVLQRNNYSTYYMTDEVRFANFTHEYGFDVLETPVMGVLDFTFGMTIDFVFTNLLSKVNFLSGLFPYTYANRAASTVYEPNDFSARADDTLNNIEHKPFFMVVHHCLPHWPYYRYMSPVVQKELREKYTEQYNSPIDYLNALRLADIQVGRLLKKLKASGHLDNSIVVLLSDHGEGLGVKKDFFLAKENAKGSGLVGFGHGTFVLSKAQNNVLLGMQRYKDGEPAWEEGTRSNPSSLVDITPTISEIISLPEQKYEGVSLLPFLENKTFAGTNRVRYVESGITSKAVDTSNPDESKLFRDYARFYHITDDKRIELKKDLLMSLIKTKQRAAFVNNKGLMYINTIGSRSLWLLSDYTDNSLRRVEEPDMDSEDVKFLKTKLCKTYKKDTYFYNDACVSVKSNTGSKDDE